MGTDDEHQFIQFILTRTSGIQKVAFGFDQKSGKKAAKMVVNLCHALAGGSWTTWNTDANLPSNELSTGGVMHAEWRPAVEIQVLEQFAPHMLN